MSFQCSSYHASSALHPIIHYLEPRGRHNSQFRTGE